MGTSDDARGVAGVLGAAPGQRFGKRDVLDTSVSAVGLEAGRGRERVDAAAQDGRKEEQVSHVGVGSMFRGKPLEEQLPEAVVWLESQVRSVRDDLLEFRRATMRTYVSGLSSGTSAVDVLNARLAALEKRLEGLERHTYRRIARETVDSCEPPRPFNVRRAIIAVAALGTLALVSTLLF